MAATRLSDSQKTELVARFRGGESSQELADAYGCSSNTVSRVVKAALDPAEYERLKQSRTRRGGRGDGGTSSSEAGNGQHAGSPNEPGAEPEAEVALADPGLEISLGEGSLIDDDVVDSDVVDSDDGEIDADDSEIDDSEIDDGPGDASQDDDGPATLAIDDADDFGDDEDDDFGVDDADELGVFTPIAVTINIDDHAPVAVVPFRAAELPASAYMLVDKTVELQPRPLSEFPELAGLAADELQRQALTIFPNPRQAKRQCGRTQRVIKLPDLSLLERTAPYLLAQGISRVVIESTPYALPES
jgi:hypothetical protein